jgi:hypothetical protein
LPENRSSSGKVSRYGLILDDRELLLDGSRKPSSRIYQRNHCLVSEGQCRQAKENDASQYLEAKNSNHRSGEVSTIPSGGIGIRLKLDGGGFGAFSSALHPIEFPPSE